MGFYNTLNFWFCLCNIVLFLHAVPHALGIFLYFSSIFIILRLTEGLMVFTRRYFFNPQLSSKKKAVLITGSGSGIGYDLAILLDKLGYKVFASYLSIDTESVDRLKSCCPSMITFKLDVTSDESVRQAVEIVKENLGDHKLWAIVNNAGVGQAGEVEWSSVDEFQKVMEINATGAVRVTKAFLPLLRQSKGRVINNTSRSAQITCPGFVAYSMSKSALSAFSRGFRLEMLKWGIKVINVEPFFYKTAMTSEDTNFKLIDKMWSTATEETRMAYGEEYVEEFKRSCKKTLDHNSPKLYQVLDCFIDTIVSADPLDYYFVCDYHHKIILNLFSFLPASFVEMYQTSILPHRVKPSAITEGAMNASETEKKKE